MDREVLSVRKIVVAGVLSAVVMVLGLIPVLGFPPLLTPVGNATTMHVPAIVGGILEGPIVGAIIGTIFGFFSFFQATVPGFKDPLVAILPRILIGPVAYLTYRLVRRLNVPWMLFFCALLLGLVAVLAFQVGKTNLPRAVVVGLVGLGLVGGAVYLTLRQNAEVVALAVAAAAGTLTNTILVLTMLVVRGYYSAGVAWAAGLAHGIPEIVFAAIITVAFVTTWRRVETGRGEARM